MANAGKTVIVAALDGTFQRQVSERDFIMTIIIITSLSLSLSLSLFLVSSLIAVWFSAESDTISRISCEAKGCLYGVFQ